MLGEPLKERAPFERSSLRHRWDVCVRYVPAWADLSLMGRATNAATARTPILRRCSKFSIAKRTAERKYRDSQNISSLLFIILLFRLFISFWGVLILFCLSFAVLLRDGVIKCFLSFFLSVSVLIFWTLGDEKRRLQTQSARLTPEHIRHNNTHLQTSDFHWIVDPSSCDLPITSIVTSTLDPLFTVS